MTQAIQNETEVQSYYPKSLAIKQWLKCYVHTSVGQHFPRFRFWEKTEFTFFIHIYFHVYLDKLLTVFNFF